MNSNNLKGNEEGAANNPPLELELEYEVFLSFRGVDTRRGFTGHLYRELVGSGITTYKDEEELRHGEEIGPELLRSINKSKIAIPIFSRGYATSKWCLKELACIIECTRSMGLKAMPIFYYVTPSEVRNQIGDYEKAFVEHEKKYDKETVEKWKRALRQAGELKGWEIQSNNNRDEAMLVQEVTKVVLGELKEAYTDVTDHLVGVDDHVKEILKMIAVETGGVRIIGIYGMGGIGKTTLAKVVYNHLWHHYKSYSFLADVGQTYQSKGMVFLQKRLISNILNKKPAYVVDENEGAAIIGRLLSRKKILILLDDVDKEVQFGGLMRRCKRLNSGSRIIVATRNKGILSAIGVDCSYELSCMNSHHALQLFSKHAFGEDEPPKKYAILSQRAVDIAGGLPLALKAIGSSLHGNNEQIWENTLEKLEKVPHLEVFEKLLISFEALDDRQKQIFLDIACFFIGADVRIVIHFWEDELYPKEAIEVLKKRLLIKIQKDNSIWMHNHMRDVAREIVRKEHNERPEKRSRPWDIEEATKFFMRNMGHKNVQGICLDFRHQSQYCSPERRFAQLPNLRLLHVNSFGENSFNLFIFLEFLRNETNFPNIPLIFSKLRWLTWNYFSPLYGLKSFSLENLVILDLSLSQIESSWHGWSCIKMAKKLKVLNLKGCNKLVKTPNFSSHVLLERVILEECSELVEIDASIGMLEHLIVLNLRGCRRLCKLPEEMCCLESLEELIIDSTSISEIPHWPGMTRLKVFSAYESKLEALPESIGEMVSLIELNISLSGVTELPSTIVYLKNLKTLGIARTCIRELPNTLWMMENLKSIESWGCDMVELPRFPQSLVSLRASLVEVLRVPDLSYLIHLKELLLSLNRPFEEGDPELQWIERLPKLEDLTLDFPCVTTLDANLGALSQLKSLVLVSCENLRSIPKLSSSLESLRVRACGSLGPSLDLSNLGKLVTLQMYDTRISKLEGLDSCCRALQDLDIWRCEFSEINGLEILENLTRLKIWNCGKLQRLPDLSNLKKLKSFNVWWCCNLVEIQGRLEPLDEFRIVGCDSLMLIPEIGNRTTIPCFALSMCRHFPSTSSYRGLYGPAGWYEQRRRDCTLLPQF